MSLKRPRPDDEAREDSQLVTFAEVKRLWKAEQYDEAINLCFSDGSDVDSIIQIGTEDANATASLVKAIRKRIGNEGSPSADGMAPVRGCATCQGSATNTEESAINAAATSGIGSLPNEILLVVFSYLDMNDTLYCMKINQHWRRVLSNNPSVWVKKPVLLEGNLEQVDVQWKRLLAISQGGAFRNLSLDLSMSFLPENIGNHTRDVLTYLNNLDLSKAFPNDSLESFDYTSSQENIINKQIWNLVVGCKNLKVLNWKCKTLSDSDQDSFSFCYAVEGTPLANCRLTEFRLDNMAQNIVFDNHMANVLSCAEVLQLRTRIGVRRLISIMHKAKGSIVDFSFYGILVNDREEDIDLEESVKASIRMAQYILLKADNLKIYKLLPSTDRTPSPTCPCFRLEAPDLIEYSTTGPHKIDHQLVQSCRRSLVKFECSGYQLQDVGLIREICSMPHVEFLSLDSSIGADCDIFWSYLEETGNLGRFLPRLTDLDIKCDIYQGLGAILVKLVQSRRQYALSNIQRITLAYCGDIRPLHLARIREVVPTVIYNGKIIRE